MTYRAVVKYALDASDEQKRKALLDGLGEIAMELVAEHDFTIEDLERALEEAGSEGFYEAELREERDSEYKARSHE